MQPTEAITWDSIPVPILKRAKLRQILEWFGLRFRACGHGHLSAETFEFALILPLTSRTRFNAGVSGKSGPARPVPAAL
jgi:hypothetical protein